MDGMNMNGTKDHSGTHRPPEPPRPLVRLSATPRGPRCPFGDAVEFALHPGGCVSLQGASGRGKTTIATVLAGINHGSAATATTTTRQHVLLSKLQIDIQCEWDPSIPFQERCGVLFQQTTLLDDLTVAGNLAVALKLHHDRFATAQERDRKIKHLLDAVGLDYDRDASKRPTELSGGMGRRACLALQLAQKKRVVVLDEPFTGLDYDAACGVAKELVRLRTIQGTALVLISHEPHLTRLVMDGGSRTGQNNNQVVELTAPLGGSEDGMGKAHPNLRPSLFGTSFRDRFLERLVDYTVYSFPLIALAFVACGLAITMLNADLLQRLEISGKVLELVETEVRPLIKLLTGEEATAFQMMGIRFKVGSMLQQTVPPAKAALFAIGLTKLFVLEVGPLLTALLLCGRIGGSYAGKVATMQATNQNKLLWTLGVNPQWWTLWPSLLAAFVAGPVLTVAGTAIALYLGGRVGPMYGIGDTAQYHRDLHDSIFPVLRIRYFETLWTDDDAVGHDAMGSSINRIAYRLWETLSTNSVDLSVTYADHSTWKDTLVEVATYPPIYHLLKATAFIVIILGVAESVARARPNLTPRGVPSVITLSVVLAGLLVILADWGFSQLWLLRH